MHEHTLNYVLGGLWAYTIDDFTYDPLNQTLTLALSVIDDGIPSTHVLEFGQVTHCAYVYATYPSIPELPRFPPAIDEEPDDHAELTAIEHYEGDAGTISYRSRSTDLASYRWLSNFVAAVWGGRLFIRAAQVQLDGVHYEVGYP